MNSGPRAGRCIGMSLALVLSGCGIIGGEDEPVAAPIPSIVQTTAPPPTQATTTTASTTTTEASTTTEVVTTTTPDELALADVPTTLPTTLAISESPSPPVPDVTIDVAAAHEGMKKLSLPFVDGESKTTIARMALSCASSSITLSVLLVSPRDLSGATQSFSFVGPSGSLYSLSAIVGSGESAVLGAESGTLPAVGSYDEWAICTAGTWRVTADLADDDGTTVSGVASVVVSG